MMQGALSAVIKISYINKLVKPKMCRRYKLIVAVWYNEQIDD